MHAVERYRSNPAVGCKASVSLLFLLTGLTYSPGVEWIALQTVTVTEFFQTTYTFTNQTVVWMDLSCNSVKRVFKTPASNQY